MTKDIYHETGRSLGKTIKVLYSGLISTCIRDVPTFGVYFYVYEYFRLKFRVDNDSNNKTKSLKIMVAGGFAGQACWVSSYPFDVIKTNLQVDP